MASYPSIELLLRQAARGVGQINARTSGISSALMPFAGRAEGYFAPMQAQEQSVGNALNQSLAQQGQQLGGDISASLASIQAPGASLIQYGQGTAQTGAQAGQAIGALSSADLERLHSQASAEQIYAAALPRLAELAGAQERRNFMAQASQDLQDLALEEASRSRDNYFQEREWRYKVRQDKQEQKRRRYQDRVRVQQAKREAKRQAALDRIAQQAAAKEYGLDVYEAQSRAADRAARTQLAVRKQNESEAQFNQRERRYQQQFQARLRAAEKSGRKPNSSLSAKYGYIVDSYGKPILTKNGKRIPIRSDSAKASVPAILGGK